MRRLLRLLEILNYPLLALSMLLIAGLGFGAAFVADFTVVNRTSESIQVTPVGTVGQQGIKAPLSVTAFVFPPLPALQGGDFLLKPGERVTILYDMDDINFSEIVIEDMQGRKFALITDPNPTLNQYHGPAQSLYAIDDLSRLAKATPAVRAAADASRRQWVSAWTLLLLLFGPWPLAGALALGVATLWAAGDR